MRLVPVLTIVAGLAACGDPLAGVDRLGDVDVAPQEASAAALPDAGELAREGFLGTAAAEGDIPAEVRAQTPEPAASDGFFRGLIRRAAAVDPAEAVAADVASTLSQPEAEVVPAALPVAAPARQRSGPDGRDVPYGSQIAFGEIARVCDARGKALGTRIEGGRRGFALYDSTPGSSVARNFYITGFADKCPRQFTAANALFGSPSFYEQIRFSPAGENLPFAATDAAYDKVKSSVCRTSRNKPCGNRIGRLDDTTAFISAYEFRDHNGQWKEFLMHDGAVLAAAVKRVN